MTTCSKLLAKTIKCESLHGGPDGASATNIFYIYTPSKDVTADATLQAACESLQNAWYSGSPNFYTYMASSWTLNEIRCIDNSGVTENLHSVIPSHSGTVSTEALPPQVAVAVGWNITAHYRGGHPRLYLPGIPAVALDNLGGRYLSAAYAAHYSAAGANMISQVSTGVSGYTDFQLGTIASSRAGACLTPPVFYAYNAATVHQRLDSQRRRSGKETAL